MSQPELTREQLAESAELALRWIRRSIAACQGKGSSHSWSPITGWRAAYPETTGYLLESLIKWQSIVQDSALAAGLRTDILSCTEWLLTLQLPSGAFPGLLAGHQQPSVFNTGQILFGLSAVARHPDFEPLFQPKLNECMSRALDWMVAIIEPDGAWRQAAYQPGFTPAYYTRALWGAYEVATRFLPENKTTLHQLNHALDYYEQLWQPNGTVCDWSFWPEKPAFTHTIAYTWEGFWHCYHFAQRPESAAQLIQAMEQWQAIRQRDQRTAGTYYANWKGDHSFRCLTGCAQLSILYRNVGNALNRADFDQTADQLLSECLTYQSRWPWPARGALPGSWPLWGPYLRGRYPNWAVKFLLDAIEPAYCRNDRS
jgi:hypothetical protein